MVKEVDPKLQKDALLSPQDEANIQEAAQIKYAKENDGAWSNDLLQPTDIVHLEEGNCDWEDSHHNRTSQSQGDLEGAVHVGVGDFESHEGDHQNDNVHAVQHRFHFYNHREVQHHQDWGGKCEKENRNKWRFESWQFPGEDFGQFALQGQRTEAGGRSW